MSHLHFTSTEIYRNRVIQLGENPLTVFNVGALGLDNIKKMKLLTKKELESSLNFLLNNPYFVVTFHPVTLENQTSEKQIRGLLQVLGEFEDYKIIFTKANADNDGKIINNLIDEFVPKNSDRAIVYKSLGQLRYLSALKYSAMMIGNSSSGIIEMPFFKKPTINIGDRQKGRIFSESIIQCEPQKELIASAIKKGLSKEFLEKCKLTPKIYGDGETSVKIKKILKTINLHSLIKKEFYDIPFNIN
jgi:UDP-hydrolysing UDP-N-acetyl-D-glucosamine 2-epimerase